jgi:beta-galactosidase
MSMFSKIAFGGDYFPEQWSEDVWKEDIRLMKKANVNMVSVAVFAWSPLQPNEDTFCFDWLDRVMEMLWKNGIDVCLATSTAAQPNWLTKKHDDILFVKENGERVAPGSRQTYCINSPSYRKAVRRLVEGMALHYRDHPALKLWHVNNEYANKNSMCFCANCEKTFREWLKARYLTLDDLNEAWGTVYWSETYGDWDEIKTPRASAGIRNGTKLMDYKRFLSEAFLSLYLEECRILRAITPHIPITTNFEADWSKFDHSLFKDELDIVSFNSYPNPCDSNATRWAALRYSMMRSLIGKPFMLMEQAPSQVDWYPINVNKRPGMMRLWSYQAIAHGSDSVMFFQWRASRKGAEKYHSGIVPHFGENSRIFKEACLLGNELRNLEDVVGSTVHSEVAVLLDNDSWWAVDNPYGRGCKSLDNEAFWASNCQPFPSVLTSYFGELERYFYAVHAFNVPVDVIPAHYDLSKYKVVIAPVLHVLKPGFGESVDKFVRDGGTFVTTYLSGVVDDLLGVFLGGYLGPLRETLGILIEEYDPLPPDRKNTIEMKVRFPGFKKRYGCSLWCDVVHATTARSLATFGEDYYAGTSCLTENSLGAGRAYYVATRPDDEFIRVFIGKVLTDVGIHTPQLPTGIEFVRRSDGRRSFNFYLNHGNSAVEVPLPEGTHQDLLTGDVFENSMNIDKQDVRILTLITNERKSAHHPRLD